MHSECTILMQFLKKIPGEAPRTPTCGRGWPPPPPSPFRRFAPQWSLRLHWSLVPPRQWRFWIRPWIPLIIYGLCTSFCPARHHIAFPVSGIGTIIVVLMKFYKAVDIVVVKFYLFATIFQCNHNMITASYRIKRFNQNSEIYGVEARI